MPRLYFSKQKMLYACWHDNSYLVLIAPGLHKHEIESHIFYSENAVKKYLNRCYKKPWRFYRKHTAEEAITILKEESKR